MTEQLRSAFASAQSRRTFLSAALLAAATLCAPIGASAQDMRAPEGDIDLTIGAGPGSGPDLLARKVADILNSEGIVENPIVVNNRTGGSWTVAATYVIEHAGDENLLMEMSPTVFATPIVQGVPNFYEQITPLAVLLRQDLLVVLAADSPYNSLTEVLEAAKAEEYSISMAGANVGSTDHIVTSLLEKAAGVKINYIPFDGGGGQITSALIGGAVTMAIYPPDEALPLIEGGEVKPIAILSPERSTAENFADIPTAVEQGFDVIWDSPQSLGLPPDTDPALVAWWDDKIQQMVASDTWTQMLEDNYFRGTYVPAGEAGAAMDDIYQRYLTVLTDLGLAKQQQ
jgi:putative tricarboxylic transport membrane protein